MRFISTKPTIMVGAPTANGTNGITTNGVLDWQKVAARRSKEIYEDIPNDYLVSPILLKGLNLTNLTHNSGILTLRELSIINLSATILLDRIRNGIFTAVEVTTAFCKSAAVAHQAVCVNTTMFNFINNWH